MKNLIRSLTGFLALCLLACNSSGQAKKTDTSIKLTAPKGKAIAAFAEGCFWCSEHIFEEIAGVDSAVSGYAGGHVKNPTYKQVCSETTGHAETVLVYYNPKVVSYSDLLDAFFSSHDPTTLNRQGPDVGTSYRSAIFYTDASQLEQAKQAIRKWTPSFKKPIVTQLEPLKAFYRAEEYHQNYEEYNPSSAYIQGVSVPRFNAFKQKCKLQLKH
ncbi:peptide-methionine (S)-S-oxide reductase MsrA (plasmid) [Pedobacter sp. BS3]|uniref:peptide-methionine (S)-S-oxide reductase MsrA n=1 Tax=Pedobacter sp. BS3 TaxID=2567937 RepID=UPI0011F0089C|nr:peptide-methionine (S)-S-oxide reductase MsrA [Pedobacter sp. BS3]TZF86130.1 peptide-methionine (S)-S-oxide reductase MsrA [Pedobacter sp. BS3]